MDFAFPGYKPSCFMHYGHAVLTEESIDVNGGFRLQENREVKGQNRETAFMRVHYTGSGAVIAEGL